MAHAKRRRKIVLAVVIGLLVSTSAIDDVGEESRSVVNLTFVRAVILILIALTGYVVARLTCRSLARRMFDTAE